MYLILLEPSCIFVFFVVDQMASIRTKPGNSNKASPDSVNTLCFKDISTNHFAINHFANVINLGQPLIV